MTCYAARRLLPSLPIASAGAAAFEGAVWLKAVVFAWSAVLALTVLAGVLTLVRNRRGAGERWRIAGYLTGGLDIAAGTLGMSVGLLLSGATGTSTQALFILGHALVVWLGVVNVITSARPG